MLACIRKVLGWLVSVSVGILGVRLDTVAGTLGAIGLRLGSIVALWVL